ncbi:MAG: hypothetical protein EH225_01905 [Calditrichaeota bacterium]|nr:hypothetical protein [Calditrichota bacterium]RQW07438.1 MAG: hypothetical protein EH225_01905 [Calditrichota bacterium]
MDRCRILLISVFLITCGISSIMARSGVEIQYTAKKIFSGDDPLFPLELSISNFSPVPVREVQVLHRKAGESRYQVQSLKSEGLRYYALLDVSDASGEIIEYYFAITYLDNRVESYPAEAPAGEVFRTAVQTLRNYGDQILIVSPEPDEQLYGIDVVITASFGSLMSMIDPEKTKMYLNTWDVSPYLQKFQDFITFAPRTVPTGRHKIRLELYNAEGNLVASREWFFSAISSRGETVGMDRWDVSGRFFAETRQEDVGNTSAGGSYTPYNQSGLQLRANYKNWNLGARVYVNNLEDADRQPVNRYSASARFNFWDSRYASLQVGDSYPKLNPMLMQNIFLRGVFARLHLKSFNVDFATGSTNRGVEGNTFVSGTDTTFGYGTFKRNITTVRPSFGAGEKFQIGFTYLKGKDDVNSIDIGINPEENSALGSDLFLALDRRRIIVEGNVNASIYNRNIAGGDIPFDTLNQVFDDDLEKTAYDWATKFITVNQYLVVRPGLAYQGRVMLRYLKNSLSFTYESVDEDFYSLGQPYLLRDNRGFHIVDNINLLKNQIFLTLGYRQYRNNLQDIKNHTTTSHNFHATMSYFPMGNIPEISIGYSNYSRDNEVPADSIGSVLNRPEDNQTTSLMASAGYRFALMKTRNRIGVDLTSYRRDDIFTYAESNTDNVTVNLQTQYSIPLQTMLEFILQQTETGPDDPTLGSEMDFLSFGIGGNYRFSNILAADQLTLQANVRFGTVTSRYDNSILGELDYNRNYYSFRLNYLLERYGSFSFIGDILTYSGDRDYQDFIYTIRYDLNF